MMNEDKPIQQNSPIQQIKNTIPEQDEHPLHMLNNQVDPEMKQKNYMQKAIRTYESDMAELFAKKNVSSASMAVAEQKKKITEQKKSAPPPPPVIRRNDKIRIADLSGTNPLEKRVNTNDFDSIPIVEKTPITEDEKSSIESNQPIDTQEQTIEAEKPIIETQKPFINENATKQSSGFAKKLFMLILSVIFIIGGLGIGYYLYLNSPLSSKNILPSQSKIPSIIESDIQKIISIGNQKNEILGQKIKTAMINENISNGKMTEFILTSNISSTTIRVTSINFIDSLGYGIPEILKRSLLNNWMLGIYGDNEQKIPFIVLKTNFFQNAYAGMLRWEATMPDEMATILNYKDKIRTLNNSSSTNSIASYFSVKGKFVDRAILNRDVREFVTDSKEVLLLYTFTDKDTIIITTSESALKGIINKLERQPVIR